VEEWLELELSGLESELEARQDIDIEAFGKRDVLTPACRGDIKGLRDILRRLFNRHLESSFEHS